MGKTTRYWTVLIAARPGGSPAHRATGGPIIHSHGRVNDGLNDVPDQYLTPKKTGILDDH